MARSKFQYRPRPAVSVLVRLASFMAEDHLLLDRQQAEGIKEQLIELNHPIPECIELALGPEKPGRGRRPRRWTFADYREISEAKDSYEKQILALQIVSSGEAYHKAMQNVADTFRVAGNFVGIKRWEQIFQLMRPSKDDLQFED